MPLPILQTAPAPGPADLVRLFHRTELHWTRHLADETQLEAGTAFANRELPGVWDANRVLDAAVPPGSSPAGAAGEAEAYFAAAGVRCAGWVMNPAAPPAQTAPLAAYLKERGWHERGVDILHLAAAPAPPAPEVGGLTIIPARASFRHARELADEDARRWGQPQLADAALLHLDDPHYDALIALKGGAAAGRVGVLAVGDVGRIDQVAVAERFRRQGVGRTLMIRALEICARSLFRHVLLCVAADNAAAQALYAEMGFRKVGQIVSYRAPWTAHHPDRRD